MATSDPGLKIVYLSGTGAHVASAAAAIQLDILPEARRPTPAEVMAVPYFGQLGAWVAGFLHFCGRDRHGNQVFVASHGGSRALVERAASAAEKLAWGGRSELVLVDCARAIGTGWVMWGYAGLALGGRARQRFSLAQVIVWRYLSLVRLVRAVRDQVLS